MGRFAISAVALVFVLATAGQASPSSSSNSTGVAGSRERMICRRLPRTGSLVEGYRTCKTRGEWDREQENIRQLSVSDTCRTRGAPETRGSFAPPDC
jgi:hypothetical protein